MFNVYGTICFIEFFSCPHFQPERMEDLLQNIIKDAAGKQQNQNLKQAAQIAYGKSFFVEILMNYSCVIKRKKI